MIINSKTKVCAIIGNPVGHSLSPIIHNAAFEEKKLNYVYTAFNVEKLKYAVEGVRYLGIRGLSVTIPHKENIIPLLDEVDEFASKIGAVNTVVNDNGKLIGSNTDASGILYALNDGGIDLKNKKVIIIGSGGAARAASFALAIDGKVSSIDLFDPVDGKAELLANDVKSKTSLKLIRGRKTDNEILKDEIKDKCLIINASPVGMYPDVDLCPINDELLNKDHCVFDVIYTPYHTKLIKKAIDAGAITVTGDKMFLKQATEQFKKWTGEEAPEKVMIKVLHEALKK